MKFTVGSIYRITANYFPMFDINVEFKQQYKENILIYLGTMPKNKFKGIMASEFYLKFYSPKDGLLYASAAAFDIGAWPESTLEEIQQ